MHSFDPIRDRGTPRAYRGVALNGDAVDGEFSRLTLVIAVKEDCLGCRSVLESPEGAFGNVQAIVVAAEIPTEAFWRNSPHPVVISKQLLADLDIRWPPFYVLIDPLRERVIAEGVVFDPTQVREEIAPFLM